VTAQSSLAVLIQSVYELCLHSTDIRVEIFPLNPSSSLSKHHWMEPTVSPHQTEEGQGRVSKIRATQIYTPCKLTEKGQVLKRLLSL
jgi:hypothetical protein